MKNYRGYYIDGCIFSSKADIDEFIKAQNIRRMQRFNAMMLNANESNLMMVYNTEANKIATFLHDHCGMTWSEIETVEFA